MDHTQSDDVDLAALANLPCESITVRDKSGVEHVVLIPELDFVDLAKVLKAAVPMAGEVMFLAEASSSAAIIVEALTEQLEKVPDVLAIALKEEAEFLRTLPAGELIRVLDATVQAQKSFFSPAGRVALARLAAPLLARYTAARAGLGSSPISSGTDIPIPTS